MAFWIYPALILSLSILFEGRAAASESHSDLWDISNGITITATSGIHNGFTASDMFGTKLSAEPGSTIFSDGRPEGFIHFVEWRTPAPVLLGAFTLFAVGDGPSLSNEREIASFVLKAKLKGTDEFTTVHSFSPSHPYALSIPAQPSGGRYNPETGFFSLVIKGAIGANYRIEASDDLISWVQIGTFPLSNGEFALTDARSTGRRARFYRAIQVF